MELEPAALETACIYALSVRLCADEARKGYQLALGGRRLIESVLEGPLTIMGVSMLTALKFNFAHPGARLWFICTKSTRSMEWIRPKVPRGPFPKRNR
eukprot:SAG31_NODE_2561_length_5481_cov_2.689335_4_plen_98_part_00